MGGGEGVSGLPLTQPHEEEERPSPTPGGIEGEGGLNWPYREKVAWPSLIRLWWQGRALLGPNLPHGAGAWEFGSGAIIFATTSILPIFLICRELCGLDT